MPIFKSLIYIGLGVNRSFNDMPMLISGLVFPLEKSISAGGKEYKELFVHAFNFDPSFAPENKTALMIMFES
jgi:hypothetical protein